MGSDSSAASVMSKIISQFGKHRNRTKSYRIIVRRNGQTKSRFEANMVEPDETGAMLQCSAVCQAVVISSLELIVIHASTGMQSQNDSQSKTLRVGFIKSL
jgi:uncharacterized membrane protein